MGEATFDAFYAENYASIAVVAGTTVGDRSVGEEIAQEALTKASERWELVSTYDMPSAWVRRVAINLALSHRRRRSNETTAWELVGRQRDVDPRVGNPAVWAAVDQLPPRQRAVVAMHYLEDRPVAYIADVLEITVSATTSHLHKARNTLAKTLGVSP